MARFFKRAVISYYFAAPKKILVYLLFFIWDIDAMFSVGKTATKNRRKTAWKNKGTWRTRFLKPQSPNRPHINPQSGLNPQSRAVVAFFLRRRLRRCQKCSYRLGWVCLSWPSPTRFSESDAARRVGKKCFLLFETVKARTAFFTFMFLPCFSPSLAAPKAPPELYLAFSAFFSWHIYVSPPTAEFSASGFFSVLVFIVLLGARWNQLGFSREVQLWHRTTTAKWSSFVAPKKIFLPFLPGFLRCTFAFGEKNKACGGKTHWGKNSNRRAWKLKRQSEKR